ncbi:MAG: hypothetical protein VKN15_05585 [Cyanobacteriota bacterium]|nr:hypothetical protein [Cyanobacteriota bacterium]
MPRSLRSLSIHLMLEGGHVQIVEFSSLEDFQSWYGGVLAPAAADAFVTVPLTGLGSEYLVVRAGSVVGIRVEPVFGASME